MCWPASVMVKWGLGALLQPSGRQESPVIHSAGPATHAKAISLSLSWLYFWLSLSNEPIRYFSAFWPRGERECPFPSIPKNESLWFPFPNYGNGFFSCPSRSWIVGMDLLNPFPFPNLLFHRLELDCCKRYQASNFFSFLYISQNNYIEEVNEPRCSKMSDWKDRTLCSVLLQIVLLQRCYL